MRIAFFSLNRLSYEGGAENYIAEVGTALAVKGHEVHYAGDFRSLLKLFPLIGVILGTTSFNNARNAQRELEKLPSMRKNTEHIKKIELNLKCFLPFTKNNRSLRSFLDSSDTIFVKNEIIDMFFFFLLGRKFLPKTNLIIFTTLYYPIQNDLRSKIHNFFYTGFLYKWFLKRYAGVIVSNKFELGIIPQKYNYPITRMHYVPYGLRMHEFKSLNIKRNNNKFRILFAGRLEKQKGIYYLKDLIKMLSQRTEFKQIIFSIAGSGPQQDIAIELSKKYKNVLYLGLVPKEEMIKLYNTHDVVIIPSIWETFSYVCLEAQRCGIPVIAFDIPGPNEIVVNGTTGKLIPLGNLEKFEEAIIELFYVKKNPTEYKQMKEMAIKYIKNRFSIERVISNLERIFEYEKYYKKT